MTKLVVYNVYEWHEMKWIETTKLVVYIMNMKLPKKGKWLLKMMNFWFQMMTKFCIYMTISS